MPTRYFLSSDATRRAWHVASLWLLTVVVLVWRRPDQFSHPYIWGEESFVLRDYTERGLAAIFGSIHGFPDLIARAISVFSFQLSILHAPWIGLILTTAFTAFVVSSVYLSPTHLRWRYLCATVTLIIPTGPENYAVTLYSFWWAGLLLLLALLWRESHQALRAFFIALGGLSSPIIIPLAPLFVLRALASRERRDGIAAFIALSCALVTSATALVHYSTASPAVLSLSEAAPLIGKFVGGFVASAFASTPARELAAGLVMLTICGALAYGARDRLDQNFALLIAALIAIIAATALRNKPSELLIFQAAPRYFFYPYILIAWSLFWIAATTASKPRRIVATALVGFGIAQGLTHPLFTWRHDPLDWRANIEACAAADNFDLQIHVTGGSANPLAGGHVEWRFRFSGEQCRKLIERSLL